MSLESLASSLRAEIARKADKHEISALIERIGRLETSLREETRNEVANLMRLINQLEEKVQALQTHGRCLT